MTNRWSILIFGMSGDLAKRQIIPALYELFKSHATPMDIIGIADSATTAQNILNDAKPFIEQYDETIFQAFAQSVTYYQVDITDAQPFARHADVIHSKLNTQRIAYLAVSSHLFRQITQQLVSMKIIEPGNQNHRMVYEKPFGWDTKSAEAINAIIAELLTQEQVYRIDHYLTKSLVSNILLMRFSNSIFEPLWNKDYLEKVEIIVDEALGLEGRGAYYDSYGALKDVVQNHVLQILALIALEEPSSSNYEVIQKQKAAILEKVGVDAIVSGQYQGYQNEPHVKQGSTTETFVACRLHIDQPRWRGVPLYVRTGKRLAKKMTEIKITFKQTRCFIESAANCLPNVLTITLAPEEGFRLRLNAKKPQSSDGVTTADLEFCYSCLYATETPQAYALLLQSVIEGDHSITVSAAEINAQWRIIEALQALHAPLMIYAQGSEGPAQAAQLILKKGNQS